MLRLGILPEGYIYPKEERPVRDLLRKRGHLMRLRTSVLISLENIISRNCGRKVNANDVKRLREDRVTPHLEGQEDLALAGRVSKETVEFLTYQIREIERAVLKKVALKERYRLLLTIPGVGKILGLVIMLETGPISRFKTVGDYGSRTAVRCRVIGRAMGSGRDRETRKMGIDIWRGPMQRHRISLAGFIQSLGPIISGRCRRPIRWWLTAL
jgi:hypothetical protein